MHNELCKYGVHHGNLQYWNILQVAENQKGNHEETGVNQSPVHGLQFDYRIIDLESATLTWDAEDTMEWAVKGRIKRILRDIAGCH